MAKPYLSIGGICEQVLTRMPELTPTNYTGDLGRQTGMLDFITSDALNGGIKSELVSTSEGKLREARVTYRQRTADCEVLTGSDAIDTNICASRVEDDLKEVTVSVEKRIASRPRQFSVRKLYNVCQNIDTFINEFLMSDIRAMREQLSRQIILNVDADAGVNYLFSGGSTAADTSTDIDLIDTSTAQPLPFTGNYLDIRLNYEKNQLGGVPVIIGEGKMHQYFQLANLACCNSATPLNDAIATAGAAYFFDQTTHSAIGNNEFLVLAPDATHLLWYNANDAFAGRFMDDTFAKTVIPDPVNPRLSWDWEFKYDECGGEDGQGAFVYQLSAYWDVFNAFQSDAFKTSTSPTVSPACADELDGMTGIFKYRAT